VSYIIHDNHAVGACGVTGRETGHQLQSSLDRGLAEAAFNAPGHWDNERYTMSSMCLREPKDMTNVERPTEERIANYRSQGHPLFDPQT
jgi:hypothetical protein